MNFKPSKYAPRTAIEKVSVTFDMDRPRYNALQRLAGKRNSSAAHLLREGLNHYPEFYQLHQEEKEAYARNQNKQDGEGRKVKDQISQDVRGV